MSKSFTTEAIVLKRRNTGELDRVVTLFTKDSGKLVCVAKGVRKMSSSQRAFLEPGNHVSIQVIETHGMPLLTQTRLHDDFAAVKTNLLGMKRLTEVLEIVDHLFPEGVAEETLFQKVLDILQSLCQPKTSFVNVQKELAELVAELGYPEMAETSYTSVLEYVAHVAEKPMKSYDFLTLKRSNKNMVD